MSQTTFWDGDEKEYEETVAKIKAVGRGERIIEREEEAQPPRRDFKLKKSGAAAHAHAHAHAHEPEQAVEERTMPPMTAEHLAAQLFTLWKQGIITGPDDDDIEFYCRLVVETGGTVVDKTSLLAAQRIVEEKALA